MRQQTCPNSEIDLIGYSSGADIIAHVAQSIGHREGTIPTDRLDAVIATGNPSRFTNIHLTGYTGPGEGLLPPTDYGSVAQNVYDVLPPQ